MCDGNVHVKDGNEEPESITLWKIHYSHLTTQA